jgi:protein-tyrosine-phosphatase
MSALIEKVRFAGDSPLVPRLDLSPDDRARIDAAAKALSPEDQSLAAYRLRGITANHSEWIRASRVRAAVSRISWPPRPSKRASLARIAPAVDEGTYNVLFLCTGNSARSILAELLIGHWGKERFKGYSAGSFPKGAVHPAALDLLERLHLPTRGLRSKSWNEFARPGAPVMDFVFTVCDQAAGEACPVWPGNPVTAHWGCTRPGRCARHGGGAAPRLPRGACLAREPDQAVRRAADREARPHGD